MITRGQLKVGLASLVALDPASPGWGVGLRFSVGCGTPPIIGVAIGQPALGVFAAIGALFPLLADIGGTPRERLTLMFATSCAMTLAAAIGALTAGDFWIVLILTALGAFATAWVARSEMAPVPVALYATVFLLVDIAYLVFEREVLALADQQMMPDRIRKRAQRRTILAVVLFGIGAVVAPFVPLLGFGVVCTALLLYLSPEALHKPLEQSVH